MRSSLCYVLLLLSFGCTEGDAPSYAPVLPLRPRTPAFPLSSLPMSAAAAFANTLAAVATAWPNATTTFTPSECAAVPDLPGCSFSWAKVVPLRCASARIYAQVAGRADPSPFARLLSSATAEAAAIAALREGGVYTVDYTNSVNVLTGLNIYVLNWFNLSLPLEIPVWYDIIRPPEVLWADGRVSSTLLDSYLLDTLGYDCVMDGTVETVEGALFKSFLWPHQTTSHRVLAAKPVQVKQSEIDTLLTFTRPFTPGVWGTMWASFMLSAFLMLFFEQGKNGAAHKDWALGAFSPKDGTRPRRVHLLAHGFYIAAMSFVTGNSAMFPTRTVPGRIYNTFSSFAILLIVSSYVANLSALLSQGQPFAAAISSVADFGANAARACVLNTPEDAAFVATLSGDLVNSMSLLVLNSSRPSDLAAAILGGQCAGALVDQTVGSFLLGPGGDPAGAFCSLGLTGPQLGQGLYALAFSHNVSDNILAALSGLVTYSVLTGTYGSDLSNGNPATSAAPNSFGAYHPQCATGQIVPATVSYSLTLAQFAGIFLVLIFGALLASFVKLLLGRKMRGAAGSVVNELSKRSQTAMGSQGDRTGEASLSGGSQLASAQMQMALGLPAAELQEQAWPQARPADKDAWPQAWTRARPAPADKEAWPQGPRRIPDLDI